MHNVQNGLGDDRSIDRTSDVQTLQPGPNTTPTIMTILHDPTKNAINEFGDQPAGRIAAFCQFGPPVLSDPTAGEAVTFPVKPDPSVDESGTEECRLVRRRLRSWMNSRVCDAGALNICGILQANKQRSQFLRSSALCMLCTIRVQGSKRKRKRRRRRGYHIRTRYSSCPTLGM